MLCTIVSISFSELGSVLYSRYRPVGRYSVADAVNVTNSKIEVVVRVLLISLYFCGQIMFDVVTFLLSCVNTWRQKMRNFFRSFVHKPDSVPMGATPFLSGEQIANRYAASAIRSITSKLMVEDKHIYEFVIKPVHILARRFQSMPASKKHHHAYPYGLFIHTLNVVDKSLGFFHERHSSSDSDAVIRNYGVFVASLFHDFSKSVFRFNLECYDRQGNYLFVVNGLSPEHQASDIYSYKVKPIESEYRKQTHTNNLGLSLLPSSALSFVSLSHVVLSELVFCLSCDRDHWGAIGSIVNEADMASVKEDIGEWGLAGDGHDFTVSQIRSAISNKLISWNTKQSQAWCCGNRFFIQPGSLYKLISRGERDSFTSILNALQNVNAVITNDGTAVQEVAIRLPNNEVIKRKVLELNSLIIGRDYFVDVENDCEVLSVGEETPNEQVIEEKEGMDAPTKEFEQLGQLNDDKAYGEAFIEWLKASSQDGSLLYNSAGAAVHVLGDYVLLVSPRIFKMFLEGIGKPEDDYEAVQKSFQKIGIHVKAVIPGERAVQSFHSVKIINTKSKLRGYLVKSNVVFGDRKVQSNRSLELRTKLYEGKK